MSIDLIDIKIENGRWVLDASGDVVFIRGAERVRQQLEFHMSLWAGEWFLDTSAGVPYNPQILGKLGGSALTLDAVIGILRDQMLSVDGVLSITDFQYTFDPAERFLRVNAELMSEFGLIAYTNSGTGGGASDEEGTVTKGIKPINMFTRVLDPRVSVVSSSPTYYRGIDGTLQTSSANDWPLWYSDHKLAGRLAPDFPYNHAFPNRKTLNDWTATGGAVLIGEESPDGLNTGLQFNATGAAPHVLKSPALGPVSGKFADLAYYSAGLFFHVSDNVKLLRLKVRNITADSTPANLLIDTENGEITQNLQNAIRPVLEYFGSGWWMVGFGFRWTGGASTGQMELTVEDPVTEDYSINLWGPLLTTGTDIRGTSPGDTYAPPVLQVMRDGDATEIEVFYSGRANEIIPFNGADSVQLKNSSLNSWGKTFITRIEYRA